MAKRAKTKTYAVRVRYTIEATIEVEASDEEAAKREAHDAIEVPPTSASLVDWDFEHVREIEP